MTVFYPASPSCGLNWTFFLRWAHGTRGRHISLLRVGIGGGGGGGSRRHTRSEEVRNRAERAVKAKGMTALGGLDKQRRSSHEEVVGCVRKETGEALTILMQKRKKTPCTKVHFDSGVRARHRRQKNSLKRGRHQLRG